MSAFKKLHAIARLYLNDELVGEVTVQGSDASWTFGDFTPHPAFSKYAPHFGRWALLMHEDPELRLHPAASEELRDAEMTIDGIDAKLHYLEKDQWHRAMQLNIDGTMIEWVQY
jgi:hypothetical protein